MDDFEDLGEKSKLEVLIDQWVLDSGLDVSGNAAYPNNYETPDWLEKMAWNEKRKYSSNGGIVGEVMSGVRYIKYGGAQADSLDACGYVPKNGILSIWVSGSCYNKHRTNLDKELSKTILHESRHTWQNRQLQLIPAGETSNDYDGDGCPKIVANGTEAGPDESTSIQDGTPPTTGDDSMDHNITQGGVLILDNTYEDASPYPQNPTARVSRCKFLIESDASEFASDHK